ncbi:hypothetical protein ACVJBD_007372 [Rhizobium mongolense]
MHKGRGKMKQLVLAAAAAIVMGTAAYAHCLA